MKNLKGLILLVTLASGAALRATDAVVAPEATEAVKVEAPVAPEAVKVEAPAAAEPAEEAKVVELGRITKIKNFITTNSGKAWGSVTTTSGKAWQIALETKVAGVAYWHSLALSTQIVSVAVPAVLIAAGLYKLCTKKSEKTVTK